MWQFLGPGQGSSPCGNCQNSSYSRPTTNDRMLMLNAVFEGNICLMLGQYISSVIWEGQVLRHERGMIQCLTCYDVVCIRNIEQSELRAIKVRQRRIVSLEHDTSRDWGSWGHFCFCFCVINPQRSPGCAHNNTESAQHGVSASVSAIFSVIFVFTAGVVPLAVHICQWGWCSVRRRFAMAGIVALPCSQGIPPAWPWPDLPPRRPDLYPPLGLNFNGKFFVDISISTL